MNDDERFNIDKWAFTFGYGDEDRRNKYVVFAGTYHEARREMTNEFGNKWAFQYPWEAFQQQIKDYSLTELEYQEEESLKDVPFIAIGNGELQEDLGDSIVCDKCGDTHQIEYGTQTVDGKQVASKLLAFVTCGDTAYLAGVNGKKFRSRAGVQR